MAGYRLTAKARSDIDGQYEFSVATFGLRVAREYFTSLESIFEIIGANPMIGISVEHIKPGYRRFVHRRHAVYYRIDGATPVVERVLQTAQDPWRNLGSN